MKENIKPIKSLLGRVALRLARGSAPVAAGNPARTETVHPATGQPVVRDLRFRQFAAHRRETYFAPCKHEH